MLIPADRVSSESEQAVFVFVFEQPDCAEVRCTK